VSVDSYLRKVGAIPSYARSDLLCGLSLICESFSPEEVYEPDCIRWTQISPETEEDNFNIRCDFILYGSSGNILDLLTVARKAPSYLIEEAMDELLKLCLFNYSCYRYFHIDNEEGLAPWDQDFEDPKWYVNLMNLVWELEGKDRFRNWEDVLDTFKNGILSDSGLKSVVRTLSSPPQKFSYKGHPEILYPGGEIPESVKSLLSGQ
jgi:hypothetical protein